MPRFLTVLVLQGPVAHAGEAEELDAAGIRTVIEARLAAIAADSAS